MRGLNSFSVWIQCCYYHLLSLSLFLSAVLTLSLYCTNSFSLLYTVPRITEAPGSLENTTPGKPAEFVAKAIGNKLAYTVASTDCQILITK